MLRNRFQWGYLVAGMALAVAVPALAQDLIVQNKAAIGTTTAPVSGDPQLKVVGSVDATSVCISGICRTVAKTTADQNNSTTSLVAITGLSFPVAASTSYAFNCVYLYTAGATTTGIGFSANVPSGATLSNTAVIPTSTTAGVIIRNAGFSTATPVASSNTVATVTGSVVVAGTAGTLAMTWRSEVAAVTTIKAGSYCELTKL